MNRRGFLVSAMASLLGGTAAHAKDYSKDILRQLKRNGYAVVSVSTTLLGRTRIRATKSGGEREIILNAATGEILRDVWVTERNDGKSGSLHDDDDDDDEEDDEDEDEDEEDNSGSGGGSGGGGSGGGGDDDDGDDD